MSSVAVADTDVGLANRANGLADEMWDLLQGSRTAGADPWSLIEDAVALLTVVEGRLALQRERLSHYEALATTDPLTGVLNRRGFDQQMQRALAAARRHDESGVLLFVDLNGFKGINDRLGHAAGDATLCHVARILAENVRENDLVARLGGDEFIVVLTKTSAAEARSQTRRLSVLLNNAMVPFGDGQIAIRSSLGSAPYGPDDTATGILCRADAAMYANKPPGPSHSEAAAS